MARTATLALTLEPQLLDELYEPRPRELIFVLDSSCSMEGRAWETATATVRTALAQMRPRDTFNLVSFSDDARVLFSEPQASTSDSRDAAEAWMEVFEGGGTNMTTGLTTSLDMEGRSGTLRLVVMLTDGFVNNEAEIGAVVSEHLGGSRLFALGIGGSVNRYLLESLAEMGHGDATVQLPETPIHETVDAFYERISHPAMSHINIEWDGLEVSEQYPRVLPDLWAGQPLRVVARYTGEPPESITLRGTVGWKRIEIVADVEAREEGSKVARLWARRKLADVERYPQGRTPDQVRDELTELALDYGLVSRWTSLVAVDEVPCPCADAEFVRFAVPHERPKHVLPGGGLGGGGYAMGLGGLGTRGYGTGSSHYGHGTLELGRREPVIMGSIDHSMIEDVIKAQLNAVRACYNVQLRAEAELEGELVLRFEVAGDGRVVRTTAVSNGTGSEDLAECVADRFFMMRFPAPPGGGALSVTYPFVFTGGRLATE